MSRVSLSMLGPLEVRVDDKALALGGTKQRSLLALLLVDANHVVSVDRIIDALWGEDANERATNTLQVHVSNLRKALTPVADALGQNEVVAMQRPGYVINVPDETVDFLQLRALSGEGDAAFARDDYKTALVKYRDALALVRGEPLADLQDEPFADSIARHVSRQVASIRERSLEVQILLGNHREVLGDIESAVAAEPLNEHLRGLLMIALFGCGRQADALAAFQAARAVLVEQLGIEPSRELRDIEARVLAQDQTLSARATFVDADLRTMLRSSVLVPRASLLFDEETGKRVDLTRPVNSIGRKVECDVAIEDSQVSRLHAEIRVENGEFVLVDRGSTNGTFVNGDQVRERRLTPGDEIRIAGHRMIFELSTR